MRAFDCAFEAAHPLLLSQIQTVEKALVVLEQQHHLLLTTEDRRDSGSVESPLQPTVVERLGVIESNTRPVRFLSQQMFNRDNDVGIVKGKIEEIALVVHSQKPFGDGH